MMLHPFHAQFPSHRFLFQEKEVCHISQHSCEDACDELCEKTRAELDELQEETFDQYFFFDGAGERLYTNEELLSWKGWWKLSPEARSHQYFLRNGKEATFAAAEKLGVKHHQEHLGADHPLTKLYKKADIDIEGRTLDILIVPNGHDGGRYRKRENLSGKDELIMSMPTYNGWNFLGDKQAKQAGYSISPKKAWNATLLNELSHELNDTSFGMLFKGDLEDNEQVFADFVCEIPNLRIGRKSHAFEFLSDVAHMKEQNGLSLVIHRIANMNPERDYFRLLKEYEDKEYEDFQYWYSIQVLKYAMTEVLCEKGYNNAEEIMEEIIGSWDTSIYPNEQSKPYKVVRKYFTKEDFLKVAKIQERIGVELLKAMKPYYQP